MISETSISRVVHIQIGIIINNFNIFIINKKFIFVYYRFSTFLLKYDYFDNTLIIC